MKNQIRSYDDDTFLKAITLDTKPCFAEARELAYRMSETAFDNIRDFPYVYFTDGATGAINSLIPKFTQVKMKKDDYRYVRCFGNVSGASPEDAYYFSYPYSGTGRFESIPTESPVILDCSYMFASNNTGVRLMPANVSHAIFSLSKSHNLSTLRCGWFFSRSMVPEFHVLQYQYDYGSSVHVSALREAIKVRPNELYNRYMEEFSERYTKAGVTEGATNLFGVLSGDRVPYYMLSSSN